MRAQHVPTTRGWEHITLTERSTEKQNEMNGEMNTYVQTIAGTLC